MVIENILGYFFLIDTNLLYTSFQVLIGFDLYPYISNAAAHAGAKVASRATKNNDASACHVFAAMIANTFDDSACATISYRETLGYDAANIGFAAGCAIEVYVTGDDA